MSACARNITPVHIDPLGDYGEVEVDLATVIDWVRDNMPKRDDNKIKVAEIDTARAKLGLPRFKVVRSRAGDAPVRPVVVSGTPAVGDSHTSSTKGKSENPTVLPAWPTNEYDLIDLVATYDGTITGVVTPRLAEFILTLNTRNRPLTKRSVERFMAILRNGQWINTGEGVILSNDGRLNDGQHRLTAILRTGIPANMDLRFGIAREAFAATGTGARRTLGNALAIAGKPHATMQAAIGRLLVHHDAGQMHRANNQVEGQSVIDITDAEPAIATVAALMCALKFKPARCAPFGFVLVLASRVSPMERVEAFARSVDLGKADEEDATRRLHVRLRDAAINKERMHQVDVAVLTIRAWNAWIAGRPVQQLKVLPADRTGEGFPKVVGA